MNPMTRAIIALRMDKEYYGLALFNYSEDEPIDRILEDVIGIKDKKARVIIDDWLKNRPSIIFLLTMSITCIFLRPLAEYYQFSTILYADKCSRLLVQLCFSTIAFLICFPLLNDFKYISAQTKKSAC